MSKLTSGEISREWLYTTTDTYEQVVTTGYFNETFTELRVGDIIKCVVNSPGVQTFYRFVVLESTNVVVTLDDLPDEGISEETADLSQRVSALETDTPVPDEDPTADATWNVTLDPNKLTPNVLINNYTPELGASWAITKNTTATPTVFIFGVYDGSETVAAYGSTETWRFWQTDNVNGPVEVLQINTGLSGITITATATAPPVFETVPFAVTATTDTTVTVTVPSATIIDEIDLRYDVIDFNTGVLINSSGADVTPGSVTVTDLSPDTIYNLAVKVYSSGDESRFRISNNAPATTTTTLTFTVFVISQDGTTTTIDIDTLTQSGGDRFNYTLVNEEPHPSDAGWLAIPSTIDFSAFGYGDYTLWPWIQLSTDITNIVAGPSASVSLVAAAGSEDIFSIDAVNSTVTISELEAPSGTITIVRSNPSGSARTVRLISTDGTLGDAAVADTHYKAVDIVVSFGAAVNSVAVPFDVLYTNIGHTNQISNERKFTVSLSEASAGSVNTETGSVEIRILGSTGLLSDGALDLNALPNNLTKLTGTQIVSSPNTTYDLVEIDGQGSEVCMSLLDGSNNLTITRSILRNCNSQAIRWVGWASGVTITNTYFADWYRGWKSLPPNLNQQSDAIGCYPKAYTTIPAHDDFCSNQIIRGNKARGHGCFQHSLFCDKTESIVVENNHFENTTNEDLGMTVQEYRSIYGIWPEEGHISQIWDCSGGKHVVRGNVLLSKRFGSIGGMTRDGVSIGENQPTVEANRSFVEFNSIHGSSSNRFSSGAFAFQGSDHIHPGQGFSTWQDNLAVEMPNGGNSIGDAEECVSRRNWFYLGPGSLEATDVGRGIISGNATTCEVTDNSIYWVQYNTTTGGYNEAHQWLWSPSSLAPIGWDTQNIMDGTNGNDNWAANGETIVKGLKSILNVGGYGDGFRHRFASVDCPVGNGILRWDSVAEKLYFTAFGDAEGVGVDINTTIGLGANPQYGPWESAVTVYSNNILYWIRVSINPTLINALGADNAYWIRVTGLLHLGPTMIQAYDNSLGSNNYVDGEWGGTDEVTGGGTGTIPSVPADLAVGTATSTTIPLTWTAASGASTYRIYRDSVLIASPSSTSYTDDSPSLVQGVNYSYSVAGASSDSPPLLSEQSPPVSGVLSAVGAFTSLEDFDNVAWIKANVASVVDQGDGTWLVTNGPIATTADLSYPLSGLTIGNTYLVRFQSKNGTGTGRFVATDFASGQQWSVNPASGDYVAYNVNNAVLTQYETEFVAGETTAVLNLWEASAPLGSTVYFTVPTFDNIT